jgi:putative aldouronate transport system permease protein
VGRYLVHLGKRIVRNWPLYVLLAPLIIQLFVFSYRPMTGLVIAFQRFSPFLGIDGSPWVGWDNFYALIFGPASMFFWRAVRNTLILSFYGLLFGFPFPILLGLMFHEIKIGKFRSITQSVLLLPNFLSEVIVVGIAIAFLHPSTGIINHFLISIGVIDEGIFFVTRPEFFRSIFTFIGIWMGAGFSSLIYLASLTGISRELYESAALDGANRIQRIWYISLPGIKPTMLVLFIMALGGLLSASFERVMLLALPVTYETADVIQYFVYRMAFTQMPPNMSMAAAAGLMNAVVTLVLVVVANAVARRFSENRTSLW